MNEYDATLKGILTGANGRVLADLTGFRVERWLNIELPAVRHRRADLLGETRDGRLLHVELQSTNHSWMAVRMLEYSVAIRRKFRRFPEQVVLYVGNQPMRMKRRLEGPGLSYECRFVDMRELDAEPLLASECLEDNVIAVLGKLKDQREGVRRILTLIGERDAEKREAALSELMVLAGLRKLGTVVEREIERMPILDDIMDHEVIGRERRAGMALGKRTMLLSQIGKRFGSVPEWAIQRVDALSADELERAALRLLDAPTLEELLG